ncbi:MAG: hypothetical protein B6I38_09525 [Anaerolineaceae bacterium 4572_5.1]|nr:MAG: hypothetical protein B6I38_09525 [Anaerolineaceae bacterium 4572_5.1]
MTEYDKWEYRVETIGSVFGTKDELLQDTLDEWGEEGWEVISARNPANSSKTTIVAKRPLTRSARRLRNLPS